MDINILTVGRIPKSEIKNNWGRDRIGILQIMLGTILKGLSLPYMGKALGMTLIGNPSRLDMGVLKNLFIW